jgi:hypothetical protein
MVKQKKDKTETHELVVRTNKDIEQDTVFLEIEIPDGFKDLLNEFAVKGNGNIADCYGKKRHLIKNILANSDNWKSVYEIFFLKDLLKTGSVAIEISSLSAIQEINNRLSNIRELVELMLGAKVNEETKYIVDVKKEKYEETYEEQTKEE